MSKEPDTQLACNVLLSARDPLELMQRHERQVRSHPSRAIQFEKAIADAYCLGETRLTIEETWHLSACSVGDKYGGGKRG